MERNEIEIGQVELGESGEIFLEKARIGEPAVLCQPVAIGDMAAVGTSRAEADIIAAAEAGSETSHISVRRWRGRTCDVPRGERLAALIDLPRAGRPRK